MQIPNLPRSCTIIDQNCFLTTRFFLTPHNTIFDAMFGMPLAYIEYLHLSRTNTLIGRILHQSSQFFYGKFLQKHLVKITKSIFSKSLFYNIQNLLFVTFGYPFSYIH